MEAERAAANGTIRAMRREDVAAVSAILAESPEAANWNVQSLPESLNWPGMVALVGESGRAVMGFVMARQTADEAEILNIAVASLARGKGIGGHLLEAALKEFAVHNVCRIFLEVRESNGTAKRFYERAGFVQTGKRAKYYRDPEEAAVLMEKRYS